MTGDFKPPIGMWLWLYVEYLNINMVPEISMSWVQLIS